MKNLNFLSNLWGQSRASQSSDVGFDCRSTVGSPSFNCRSFMLKLVSVLAVLLTLGVGQMWGAANSVSINGNSITGFGSGSNYTSGSFTSGDITIESNSGFSTTQFRVAKSKTMTISTSVGKITKIVVTCSSTSYKFNDATNLSYNNAVGTYTNAAGTTSVTFTNSNANIARITKIEITYGYLVTYDNNGGSGTATDANSPYASGATVTTKAANTFTAPGGKTFNSWNTASGGGGTSYAAGATFKISAHTTLYAQWVSAASCSADPTIGAASLNGSFNSGGVTSLTNTVSACMKA